MQLHLPADVERAPSAPLTVLLAVDNAENRRTLQRHLQEHTAPAAFRSAHFDEVDGADHALAQPRLTETALVVLDCAKEIAPDAVARLRAAAPRAALVAISDSEDEERTAALVAAGADDYLPRGRLSGYWLWHALAAAYARRSALSRSAALADVGAALDRMGDTFFALDREWRFTYVNRHYEESISVPAHKLIGRNIWTRFPFLIGSAVEHHYRRALATQQVVRFEIESHIYGGWYAVTVYPSPDGLSVYARDITARKQAEEERDRLDERVIAKRKRLIAVLEHIPVGVLIVDAPSGRLWMVNQRIEQILGHPLPEAAEPDEPHEQEEQAGAQPGERPDLWRIGALGRAISAGEETLGEEMLYRQSDGRQSVLSLSAVPVYDDKGQIIAGVAVIEDITARKEAEAAMLRTHERLEEMVAQRTEALAQTNALLHEEIAERARAEQTLAAVRRRIAKVREADRLQLARNLHDSALQDLISLQFQVAASAGMSPDKAAALSETLGESLGKVVAGLRHLIQELRPPVLAHFGLAAAVRAYAAQLPLPDPSPAIHVESDGEPALDETTALTLYRISQGALHNAVEHSRARSITVRIHQEGAGPGAGGGHAAGSAALRLEVEDDGVGFAASGSPGEMASQGRLGLAVMADHAENIGATFSVNSRPGAGTTVRVVVPLAVG